MSIGVCYFPEHWPRDRWETDVAEMADAGIEYVRMAEFAWSRMEPERGAFDFEWLDEVIELIDDHGMQAVLCTPTAAPPKWVVDDNPDMLQAERDGTVREFGGRRHYCFNSPSYRVETERIVSRMAERYADEPTVIGWQTDNEYGTVHCYCDDCAREFREWLREKYGDIESLNESWGTAFWSQRHTSFEEIDPPGHTPAGHHPSRLLDYHRFSNESVVEYNRLQTDLLREARKDWWITHNFMNQFSALDAHDVCEDLDFAAWDSYPTGHVQLGSDPDDRSVDDLRAGDPDLVGFNHDLYRGIGDAPFWIMEQQPGDINWPPHSPQPAEGAMRLWAHHAVAHGAETVAYFRWRRCRMGQEQYHAGLRKHDGSPDRGYRDAAQAAEELDELDADALDHVEAPVAILHDYENLWEIDREPHSPAFDYWDHLEAYYRALRARGVTVDVVHPERDLDGYAAVVAPTLHLADDSLADRLHRYVDGGGELLLTIRSGYKDPSNQLHENLPPGPFSDLVGATVAQHETFAGPLETRVRYRGEEYDYRTWGEWLEAEDADAVGVHESGVASGRTAITRRSVGDGAATYCGVWPEAELADALVRDLLDSAGVPYADRFPDGVRVAARDGRTWITNFTGDPVRASVEGDADWLLGDGSIPAYDVGVVTATPESISIERS